MYEDDGRTREELLQEIAVLRGRLAETGSVEVPCEGAEERARETEAELRAIVDALPDLVIRIRRDGQFLDIKSPSRDILALPPDEIVVGRNIRETGLPEPVSAIHLENLERALRTGVVQTFEYSLEVPRGLRDFEGRVIACNRNEALFVIRDVTDSKQTIADMQKLEVELHQARKMESVGRLAGGVAHNLNNLLTPIFGYVELLLIDGTSPESRQSYLRTVLKAARGARELTLHLLAISHRQVPEIRRVDLRQIVADFERILTRAVREDVVIEIRRSQEPVVVAADVSQVEQILLNLAINAQDAMPSGGRLVIETRDLVEAEADRRFGALRVSDTGGGIAEPLREQVFEPFFSTKEPGKGTGLGLTTVQAIVKQHSGEIRLDSKIGRGTTFEILFPSGGDMPVQATEPSLVQPEEAKGGDETVLVVEDNATVSELVCRILNDYGYEVVSAKGGRECLRSLEHHSGTIDLLLTDVVMPRISGPDLYDRLLPRFPDLEVVYMSGYTDDVIAAHGILRSQVHFVRKPFSIPDLLHEVRRALGEPWP